MNFLEDKSLLYRCEDVVPADSLLTGNTLILYYFTSMDCRPCRAFDDRLKRVYTEAVTRGFDMLVVIVSTDDDREAMMLGLKANYPEWYAVPFEDELRDILRYYYGVTHTPYLIVVRSNGQIITRRGRTEIEKIGINVLITWSS